jgi:hypothetical protein
MSRAEKRADALRELAREFNITPGDHSTTAGEDLAEYLKAPEKLGPWVAVTTAQGNSGYAINYLCPCETRRQRRRAAPLTWPTTSSPSTRSAWSTSIQGEGGSQRSASSAGPSRNGLELRGLHDEWRGSPRRGRSCTPC